MCAAQPPAAGLQRYGRTAFGPGAKARIRSAEEAQAALFARLALEYVNLFEQVDSPKHRDAFFQITMFPDLLSQAIYSVRPPSAPQKCLHGLLIAAKIWWPSDRENRRASTQNVDPFPLQCGDCVQPQGGVS